MCRQPAGFGVRKEMPTRGEACRTQYAISRRPRKRRKFRFPTPALPGSGARVPLSLAAPAKRPYGTHGSIAIVNEVVKKISWTPSTSSLTPRYRRGIIVFRNLQTPERTKEELTGIQCVIQTHLQIRPIKRTNTTHGLCPQRRRRRESGFVFFGFLLPKPSGSGNQAPVIDDPQRQGDSVFTVARPR